MAEQTKVLWADDEIDILKPHIKLLEQKGIAVTAVTNGQDAVDAVAEDEFDIIFLDENMPGISGLEALQKIKAHKGHIPVVMVTKSEEEHLMEEAIGKKISDYLIKPVNPKQILLSIKKNVKAREIQTLQTNREYQQAFMQLSSAIGSTETPEGWVEVYKTLMTWEENLQSASDSGMWEILQNQKQEANQRFGRFVMEHYEDWVAAEPADRPTLSPDLLPGRIRPLLDHEGESLFVFVLDCWRFDHWRAFQERLFQRYRAVQDSWYFSILPTATQYARNSIFSGLFPIDIQERYPEFWVFDEQDEGKNKYEEQLLKAFFERRRIRTTPSYTKVITNEDGRRLESEYTNLLQNRVNFVVVNFLDLMAHARSEMSLIKELAPDEAAFRSLATSWLEHSSFLSLLDKLATHENIRVVLTTDHGVLRVQRHEDIVGDRDTSTNLRYKHGRNLNYNPKARHIYTVEKPTKAGLPSSSVSGTFAFLAEDYYFVYPNNRNRYVRQFEDTFQHGGISLEEMIVPYVELVPKR